MSNAGRLLDEGAGTSLAVGPASVVGTVGAASVAGTTGSTLAARATKAKRVGGCKGEEVSRAE
jgi:hypothetical protein